MEEIIKKLREEDNELFSKLLKLEYFINSNRIKTVSINQANLLRTQFQIMRSYHEVLYARICDLQEESK